MPDRRPGYAPPAWRIVPDPEPFAGMDHAALVAVNKANATGRLLAEAEVERLMQHLDHKPVPPAVLPDDDRAIDRAYGHLADKARAVTQPDPRADRERWPLALHAIMVLGASLALWAMVPLAWRVVVWFWEAVT